MVSVISVERWRANTVLALLVADFALLGVTIGVQGVLWALLTKSLHISKSAFGATQLVVPITSIVLLLLGGRLSTVFGKKRLSILSLVFLAMASLMLGVAWSIWTFVTALFLFGLSLGLFETAMNGTALDWELATRRQLLNLVHGCFSGGLVLGALGSGVMLGAGWRPFNVLAINATLAALIIGATLEVRYPYPTRHDGSDASDSTVRLLTSSGELRRLSWLSALGGAGESVIFLWSVFYLRERGAAVLIGGIAFALLSGSMALGRFVNIATLGRFGPKISFQLSGIGLFCSSILLLLSRRIAVDVAALSLMSASVAGVLPTALGAAALHAREQTGALAGGMLAANYVGFMLMSPMVGLVADISSLTIAFGIVGLSGLSMWRLARETTRATQ